MTIRTALHLALVTLIALPASSGFMNAAVLDFEDLNNGELLTSQYAGLNFSNAVALTAGLDLNEMEFPPHSGSNVVSDSAGPLSITFFSPVFGVSAYFTYQAPLTIVAYDSQQQAVANVTSSFSSNLALSGSGGSTPNEFLQLTSTGGIARITFTGDVAGGSFVLDDLSYQAVPEPAPFLLVFTGLIVLLLRLSGSRIPKLPLSCSKSLILVVVLGFITTANAEPLQRRKVLRTAPLQLVSTPGIASVSAIPPVIPLNEQTPVTVFAHIKELGLVVGNVNVLRVSSTGQAAIAGIMTDDGTGADAKANDGIFTAQVQLTETTTAPVHLQVSAPFRGQLRRALSPVMILRVETMLTPEQTFNTVADDISRGDINSALRRFAYSPRNREALEKLDSRTTSQLASALRGATLKQHAGSHRVYEVLWSDPQAGTLRLDITLVRAEPGTWLIGSW